MPIAPTRSSCRPGSIPRPAVAREWVLVDLAGAPPGTVEHLPRVRTLGLTGVRFAGVESHGLRLAADSVLDGEAEDDYSGQCTAAGTSATVLRAALPALALAGLDTALRLTFHHLRSRRLYGGAASDLPAIRSLLARTFVELIACDCLAMTAARMISRLPAQAELYSLASLCLAADVVPAAMHRLSVGLGARFYVRDGSSGMFQKLLRDLKPLGLDGISWRPRGSPWWRRCRAAAHSRTSRFRERSFARHPADRPTSRLCRGVARSVPVSPGARAPSGTHSRTQPPSQTSVT